MIPDFLVKINFNSFLSLIFIEDKLNFLRNLSHRLSRIVVLNKSVAVRLYISLAFSIQVYSLESLFHSSCKTTSDPVCSDVSKHRRSFPFYKRIGS